MYETGPIYVVSSFPGEDGIGFYIGHVSSDTHLYESLKQCILTTTPNVFIDGNYQIIDGTIKFMQGYADSEDMEEQIFYIYLVKSEAYGRNN